MPMFASADTCITCEGARVKQKTWIGKDGLYIYKIKVHSRKNVERAGGERGRARSGNIERFHRFSTKLLVAVRKAATMARSRQVGICFPHILKKDPALPVQARLASASHLTKTMWVDPSSLV